MKRSKWYVFCAILSLAINVCGQSSRPGVGATPFFDADSQGVTFRVWAPNATTVGVIGDFNNWGSTISLVSDPTFGQGYWSVDVEGVFPGSANQVGAVYEYKINGNLTKRDPRGLVMKYSGIGSGRRSQVANLDAFPWDVAEISPTIDRDSLVIYELHVGAFSGEFSDLVDQLDYLQSLGVNAIELMPIFETEGFDSSDGLSLGYDPSDPYSIESAYGWPFYFQNLVDACHTRNIAVILDVVHNHWGPFKLVTWQYDGWTSDGSTNYGGIYHYNEEGLCCTEWGRTRPNFGNQEVRRYIKDHYKLMLDKYKVDGFRTDSPQHIGYYGEPATAPNADGESLLKEINDMLDTSYPHALSIQENGDTDWGFDTKWDLNFPTTLRPILTAADDTSRDMNTLAGIINDGAGLGRVVYMESHDTCGNISGNKRIVSDIDEADPSSFWARKRSLLGAAITLTSPGIPMIFEGEETLKSGGFKENNSGALPENGDYIDYHIKAYTDLIHARRDLRGGTEGLKGSGCNVYHIDNTQKILAYRRWKGTSGADDVVVVANLSATEHSDYEIDFPSAGTWHVHFNADSTKYGDDYGNIGGTTAISASGSPAKGKVSLGRYGVLILSKTAPVGSGTSWTSDTAGEGVGCDGDLTIYYNPANGPLSSAGTIKVRIGTDGWKNPADYTMTDSGTGVWSYTFSDIPAGTRGINYVFNNGGTIWDNNSHKDWYAKIDCGTKATFDPPAPDGCGDITIRYEAESGALDGSDKVFVRLGINNWNIQENPDPLMTKVSENVWEYTFTATDPTYNLSVAFHNEKWYWDTNNSSNWNVNVSNCATNTGSVTLDPLTGCDPITITFDPKIGRLANASNVNIYVGHDKWLDLQDLPMTNKGDGTWEVVIDPNPGWLWLSFAFNDANPDFDSRVWDNQYGKDWNYNINCPFLDAKVTVATTNASGCVPVAVTYEAIQYSRLHTSDQIELVTRINTIHGSASFWEEVVSPMKEVSPFVWTAYIEPPAGTREIVYSFKDAKLGADPTAGGKITFTDCAYGGTLEITKPIAEVAYSQTNTIKLIGEIHDGSDGTITWTNKATGDSGSKSFETPWTFDSIPLDAGENEIEVCVEVEGSSGSDNAGNSAYSDGWQENDNGGTGFKPWRIAANASRIGNNAQLGGSVWEWDSAWLYQFRDFASPMLVGDEFSFDIDLTQIDGSGDYFSIIYRILNLVRFSQSSANGLNNLSYSTTKTSGSISLPGNERRWKYTVKLLSLTQLELKATSLQNNETVTQHVSIELDGSEVIDEFYIEQQAKGPSGQKVHMNNMARTATGKSVYCDSIKVIYDDSDTDNDGMADAWEDANGLNKLINDSGADPDNDGVSNLEEYVSDTDPHDDNSLLLMLKIDEMDNKQVKLEWQGGTGSYQRLQWSYNLRDENSWRDITLYNPPTPITNSATTNMPPDKAVFYRIKASR